MGNETLFQFKCAGIQPVVGPLPGNQILVGSPLNNPAVVQDHDAVGVADGGQAVGNDEGGTALHQGVHALLHQGLGAGVNGGGGLVQDEHRGIGHRSPGSWRWPWLRLPPFPVSSVS